MRTPRLPGHLEPNDLSLALTRRRAQGLQVLDLCGSNPTTCGLALPEAELRQALSGPDVLGYRPDPQGCRSAREAIAAYHGHGVSPADPVLSASTSEAYGWLFKLLAEPGDEVLVPSPSYPLFQWLTRLEGLHPVEVPAFWHERWCLDLEGLEGACTERTRMLIVVNPNNPTGQFLTRSEWAGLTTLCARKGLALIVDEVFSDYALEPASDALPTALEAETPPCPVFLLSGLSKACRLPQVKLGWTLLRGPAKALLEPLLFIADQYLSVSASAQAAAPWLLSQAAVFQKPLRTRLQANLAALDRTLINHPALARLRVEGGWSVLLRRPAVDSDEACALRLLETEGVLVHPGSFFGIPGDGHLVLSLLPPEDCFAAGIARILPRLA